MTVPGGHLNLIGHDVIDGEWVTLEDPSIPDRIVSAVLDAVLEETVAVAD